MNKKHLLVALSISLIIGQIFIKNGTISGLIALINGFMCGQLLGRLLHD